MTASVSSGSSARKDPRNAPSSSSVVVVISSKVPTVARSVGFSRSACQATSRIKGMSGSSTSSIRIVAPGVAAGAWRKLCKPAAKRMGPVSAAPGSNLTVSMWSVLSVRPRNRTGKVTPSMEMIPPAASSRVISSNRTSFELIDSTDTSTTRTSLSPNADRATSRAMESRYRLMKYAVAEISTSSAIATITVSLMPFLITRPGLRSRCGSARYRAAAGVPHDGLDGCACPRSRRSRCVHWPPQLRRTAVALRAARNHRPWPQR